jgi:O-antigen chain-terminating methyltransferase
VSQEQAELYAAKEKIRKICAVIQGAFDRLGKVEQHTQELQRNNIESRVIARFEARFASLEEALGMKYGKNSFSGGHEEIKTHPQVYLPILRDIGIGTCAMPIVDLGCGRGEWLRVLQAEGLTARGVDSNPDNIEACTAIGLHVVKEDSLLYLAGLPAASVGAVTSFHMIKPDPFRLIIDLIDHAFRVLKPDGLLILETSNPSNLLLWLLMETRGFQRMRRLDYSIIGERP